MAAGAAGASGSGHRLMQSGSLTWCRVCGCYGEMRCLALRSACSGSAQGGPRAGQLARLRNGRHPISGEFLGPTTVCHLDRHNARLPRGFRSDAEKLQTRALAAKKLRDVLDQTYLRQSGWALGMIVGAGMRLGPAEECCSAGGQP